VGRQHQHQHQEIPALINARAYLIVVGPEESKIEVLTVAFEEVGQHAERDHNAQLGCLARDDIGRPYLDLFLLQAL
jgi:hypothetical protein